MKPQALKIATWLTVAIALLHLIGGWLAFGLPLLAFWVEDIPEDALTVLFVSGVVTGVVLGGLGIASAAGMRWSSRPKWAWLLAVVVHAITIALVVAVPAIILLTTTGSLAEALWGWWLDVSTGPFGLISVAALILLLKPTSRAAVWQPREERPA